MKRHKRRVKRHKSSQYVNPFDMTQPVYSNWEMFTPCLTLLAMCAFAIGFVLAPNVFGAI